MEQLLADQLMAKKLSEAEQKAKIDDSLQSNEDPDRVRSHMFFIQFD